MGKKRLALLALAVVLVPVSSWALPAVQLDPSCSYVFDSSTGFDAQASNLFLILAAAGVTGLPTDWQLADLENGMTGDGVPDWMELGLLGSVVCAGEPLVLAQFNANISTYMGLISQVSALLTSATALGTTMTTTGNDMLTWLDAPQAGLGGMTPRQALTLPAQADGELVLQIESATSGMAVLTWLGTGAPLTNTQLIGSQGEPFPTLLGQLPAFAADPDGSAIRAWLEAPQAGLGGATPHQALQSAITTAGTAFVGITTVQEGLLAAATEITGFVSQYGTYVPILGSFAPIFAGLGGLSTEMYATLENLVNVQLLGGLADTVTLLNQLRDGCLGVAGGVPIPPMTAPLQTELTATAGAINTVSIAMGGIVLPPLAIYGVAKSASEPLSGLADYNGDGFTNKFTYDAVVVGAGGTREDFIEAATGHSPFWPGNPNLPVGGLVGLAALAGVVALGGARSLRKK